MVNCVYWFSGVHFCLRKKFYDYGIDMAVCKVLLKYGGKISRRKVKWIVESNEYLGKTITNKVFQNHIKRMLKAGYILQWKDKWKRGKKLPLFLSTETSEQIRLGSLNIIFEEKDRSDLLTSYNKLKKYRKTREDRFESELKRSRIYYIVMRVLSIETPYRNYRYPGLSITDIMNARYDGHAFCFLRLEEDKELVQECLNNLERENIVKEIKTPSEDESRYELVDLRWKSFVTECSQLLEDAVMMNFHLKWQNLRPPRPQERIYYEWCWGHRNADGHLNRVYQDYKRNKEIASKRDKQQIKELIEDLDYNIYRRYKELERRSCDLAHRYSSVYKMVVETIYPEFLRLQIERTVNNPKDKDRKYHKLQSACFDDSLIFDDSAQTMTYKFDK
jgi:hypothetical protein